MFGGLPHRSVGPNHTVTPRTVDSRIDIFPFAYLVLLYAYVCCRCWMRKLLCHGPMDHGFVGWFVDGFISIDGTRFQCILIDLPTQGNLQNQIDPIFLLLPFISILSVPSSPPKRRINRNGSVWFEMCSTQIGLFGPLNWNISWIIWPPPDT